MKKLFWILPLSFILAACPFESTVPLSPAPIEPVDTSLVGFWYGIIRDGSDYFGIEALDIAKKSDSVYSIIRYGKTVKGDMIVPDTAHFTGYTSYIGKQRFMNIEGSVVIVTPRRNKEPEYKTEKIYYLSAIENRNDTLTVKTITETFSPTRKDYRTPDGLYRVVAESLGQQRNIYDDQYSLSYWKMRKPLPGKTF